jgi:hypothetical protein
MLSYLVWFLIQPLLYPAFALPLRTRAAAAGGTGVSGPAWHDAAIFAPEVLQNASLLNQGIHKDEYHVCTTIMQYMPGRQVCFSGAMHTPHTHATVILSNIEHGILQPAVWPTLLGMLQAPQNGAQHMWCSMTAAAFMPDMLARAMQALLGVHSERYPRL